MISLFATIAVQLAPTSIEGHWRNPSGSVIVSIAPCGEALCGTVESASEKAQADARRGGTDALVGTVVLSNFAATGEGRWKGRLFVPDLNKRSKAELRQLGPDQVKITGCAVGRLICKSEVWTRAAGQ
jgi:uncharacterized protein (DUF2147 family)